MTGVTRHSIPVVYVDFRENPLVNTEPSMRLIGQLFDKEEEVEAFTSNYSLDQVVLALASPDSVAVQVRVVLWKIRMPVALRRSAGWSS